MLSCTYKRSKEQFFEQIDRNVSNVCRFSDKAVTVSFSKVTMLLKQWCLIVFPIYGKHEAEPRWLTKVSNSCNFSFGFVTDLQFMLKSHPKRSYNLHVQCIPCQKKNIFSVFWVPEVGNTADTLNPLAPVVQKPIKLS